MPICPRCGNKFSGFSFGPNPATECKDCRKARAEAAVLDASFATAPSPAAPASGKFTSTVTLTLIALNVVVNVAMGLSGVSWTDPSVQQAIRWGADFGPLTLSGEWWRVFTSTFVHFGIIHIALNMWCLWSLGSSLELFMGRKAFAVIYLLNGLAASLTSIAWNPVACKRGSLRGHLRSRRRICFLPVLQKLPMDPGQMRQKLKNLAIFIGYNLLYGAAGNVDNSAHMGGLVAGLILEPWRLQFSRVRTLRTLWALEWRARCSQRRDLRWSRSALIVSRT